MNYYNTAPKIEIGDYVIADGMNGLVVCDFDDKKALTEFSGWIDIETSLDSGKFSHGIMIKTEIAGFINYPELDKNIVFVSKKLIRSTQAVDHIAYVLKLKFKLTPYLR